MSPGHDRPAEALGESCDMCGDVAWHKVRADVWHKVREDHTPSTRHGWSAYVCCECFGEIMGAAARQWCGT